MTKLFLIVGNSGSGKDALIWEVQKSFPKNLKKIKVPIRVITRSINKKIPSTEDFESISEEAFNILKKQGEFALDWYIYGLYYGVRKNIEEWIALGHPVLINVSRSILNAAKKKFPDLKIIFVKVPFEITAKRIKERGREDIESMKKRLKRARSNQSLPSADFVVDNSGDLEEAAEKMRKYIISEISN
jgi:ribose 1,5-bisphosphokinase